MALDRATIIDYAQRFRDALLSRSSLRAAAYGAAILGAVGAGSTAISLTTASLSPAQAQTMMVTPTMIPSAPASPTMLSTPIPKEQCDLLYDRANEAIEKHGKNYISRTTRRSLTAFWAFENDLPTCKGPREIAWERDTDYGFVIALADVTSGKFNGKEVDFRMGYGFRPAAKAANPTVSERAPTAAPGG